MRMSRTTRARWRSNSMVSMVTVSRSATARGGSCAKASGLAIRTPSATATVCLPSRSPKCCSVTGRPSAAEASRSISGRNQSQSHTATSTPMATTTPPSTKGHRRRRSRRLRTIGEAARGFVLSFLGSVMALASPCKLADGTIPVISGSNVREFANAASLSARKFGSRNAEKGLSLRNRQRSGWH
jgi:hypothetical protein